MGKPFSERLDSFLRVGLPVGRVGGIRVDVHSTMLILLLFWVAIVARAAHPLPQGLLLAMHLGALWTSILAHEVGHCAAARMVGGHAESILLWPLGGLANVSGQERSPYDEFVITLCGPLVSLALALSFTLVLWLIPFESRQAVFVVPASVGSVSIFMGAAFVWAMVVINWMLFVFNMAVPLFPMDAARLWRSALAVRYNAEKVTFNVCLLGLSCGGILVGLAFAPALFGFDRAAAAKDSAYFDLNLMLALLGVFGSLQCLRLMKTLDYHYVYTDPFRGREALDIALARIGLGPRRARAAKIVPISKLRDEPAAKDGSTELEELKAELQKAVDTEDFARAARLRDKIKNLKTGSPKG